MNHTKVFVASVKEHIEYARAIQNRLEEDFHIDVWDHIFNVSEFILESLLIKLNNCDFAIFVMAPADVTTSRDREYVSPRDNIIFELGLFMGLLGRKRVFVVTPRNLNNLKLPSDLSGYLYLTYDDGNHDLDSALGPACNKIRKRILEGDALKRSSFYQCKLYPDLHNDFPILLNRSKSVVLYFIHSRSWRDGYLSDILKFLDKRESILHVFLPDLSDKILLKALEKRFDDGKYIKTFIMDAYRHFLDLKKAYAGKVKIFLYKTYPTYSFYKFDDLTVVCLYPSSSKRKSSPSFLIEPNTVAYDFFSQDLIELTTESSEADDSVLGKLK